MMADIIMTVCLLGRVLTICNAERPPPFTWAYLPTSLIAKSISGLCEHSYLIARFYFMSKNIPLTIILGILTGAQLGSNLGEAGYNVTHSHLAPPRSLNPDATMAGWAFGAAVDVFVAIGLVWQFLRYPAVFSSTKSIVRKYVVSTVISGGLTALYGVTLLILFPTESKGHIILTHNFGKIYAITVYANLALVQGIWSSQSCVVLAGTRNIPGLSASTNINFAEKTDHCQSSPSKNSASVNATNPSSVYKGDPHASPQRSDS
jgi:hypothetical protein